MNEPELDIIVPVHDAGRPVARLARSVLTGNSTPLRLTFVCHGIPGAAVRDALGSLAADIRVRLLEFSDGVRGPAGPFIAGLEAATAPFVMKIDSDDSLEAGAVDAWMQVQETSGADIVICRMRSAASSTEWSTPPARPGRRRSLDPVRDRLAYRTSTMGIIRRELMAASLPARALPTGEDIESSLKLWFSGASIALAAVEPAYLVHDDGPDRATTRLPAARELAWLERLRSSEFFDALPAASRRAIVTKLMRVQLFGAVTARAADLTPEDLAVLGGAARTLVTMADGVPPWLSRADQTLLDVLLSRSPDPALIALRADARRRFGHPGTLVPRRIRWTLHREAPVRTMIAFTLARRRRTAR